MNIDRDRIQGICIEIGGSRDTNRQIDRQKHRQIDRQMETQIYK